MWYVKRSSGNAYLGAYEWVETLDEAVRFKSWGAVSKAATTARQSNSDVSIVHVRTRSGQLLAEMHKAWTDALNRAHTAEEKIRKLEKELAETKNPMEIRGDGKEVNKDRWETAIRNLAYILGYGRSEYEIVDIVEKVRMMVETRSPNGSTETET